MTINKTLSSNSDQDVVTPMWFIDKVSEIFPLEFDLAATKENCRIGPPTYFPVRFFSIEEDSLSQDWEFILKTHCPGKYAWLNPPFCGPKKKCIPDCGKERCEKRGWHDIIDQPGISVWMQKCVDESKKGAKIVALTLATRGTNWYQNIVRPNSLSLILYKRIAFEGAKHPFTRDLQLNIFGSGMKGEGYFYF